MSFPGHQITTGWGVVRVSAWRFDGLHPSKQQVEDRRAEMPSEADLYFGDTGLEADDLRTDLHRGD